MALGGGRSRPWPRLVAVMAAEGEWSGTATHRDFGRRRNWSASGGRRAVSPTGGGLTSSRRHLACFFCSFATAFRGVLCPRTSPSAVDHRVAQGRVDRAGHIAATPIAPRSPPPSRVPFSACPIGLTARNVRRANPVGAALLPTPRPPAPATHVTAADAATATATPPPSSPSCRCRRHRLLRSITALGAAAGADDLVSAAASRRPVREQTCSPAERGRQVHSLRTRLSRAENSLASTNGVPKDDAPHLEQRLQAPRIHLRLGAPRMAAPPLQRLGGAPPVAERR